MSDLAFHMLGVWKTIFLFLKMEGNNGRHCSFNIMKRAKIASIIVQWNCMVYVERWEIIDLRVLGFRHYLVHVIKILRDNWQLMHFSESVFEAVWRLPLTSEQTHHCRNCHRSLWWLPEFIYHKENENLINRWTLMTVGPVEDEEWNNDRIEMKSKMITILQRRRLWW